MYSCSTFSRAQGVLRRNFKLEFIVGFNAKQLIRTFSSIYSQPYLATSSSKMALRVMPCKGLLACLGLLSFLLKIPKFYIGLMFQYEI